MARFHVKRIFAEAEGTQFTLIGEVCDGVVAAGMKLLVPFNSSVSMSAVIDSVGPVAPKAIAEQGQVAICIEVEDPDELQLWRGLNINDEVLEVVPAQRGPR